MTRGGTAELAAAAGDWGTLTESVQRCTVCTELASTRTNVVPGVRPDGARMMLVGEAPGADEDLAGLPFVGRSGRLLDGLLDEAGIARADVAVVNVLKCRPPGNRTPRAAEVASCRPWLDRQLALADPRVVVTLGTTAAQWALGRSARIGVLRDRVHHWDGRALVVTYHPSAALRFGPKGAPMAGLRSDLALAVRTAAAALS